VGPPGKEPPVVLAELPELLPPPFELAAELVVDAVLLDAVPLLVVLVVLALALVVLVLVLVLVVLPVAADAAAVSLSP
jgi:hypothetical protein